jgi:hypothetical protein
MELRSLYRPGYLLTVSNELARYKLDLVGVLARGLRPWSLVLVGVQEVRCVGGGT